MFDEIDDSPRMSAQVIKVRHHCHEGIAIRADTNGSLLRISLEPIALTETLNQFNGRNGEYDPIQGDYPLSCVIVEYQKLFDVAN